MALAVVTVASGGLPVVDATASGRGFPVAETTNPFGLAVTKVAANGLPVVYASGGGGGGGGFTPSLDFSDSRNSQYTSVVAF